MSDRPNQSDHSDQSTGYAALSYLIAGVVLYGGLGWLLDHWLHTQFCLPIGLVLGLGLAVFLIIKHFGKD